MGKQYEVNMDTYEMEREVYTDVLRTSMFGIPVIGIYILGIITGELLISSGQIFSGIGIYTINLVTIILAIIFSSTSSEEKDVLQSFMPVILLRIITLSMPQFFASPLLQYSLIYAIMFMSIYFIVKSRNMSSKDLGIDFKRFHIYLPVGMIIGTIMAIIEYGILHPEPLIDTIGFIDVILISIVMFVFVGPVGEIIFRSILQVRLEKIFNPKYAILLSGAIFGMMYSSYGMVSEVLFATTFGIVNGYIFYKTRSLPFIVLVSGTANVMVFGILPRVLI